VGDWPRIVEPTELIVKRVGAPRAVECYVDHSPPPPEREYLPRLFPRLAGSGRPTKRDRRRIDDLRDR
jgi:ribosome-associated heat shock protein Hsp15